MQIIAICKLYIVIFIEFCKIGIFSFGGGYATLPFLLDLTTKYNWFDTSELSKMITLSAITPGPIGINMATYAGLKMQGIFTAIIATFGEILPAFLIVILTYKFLEKYKNSKIVKTILFSLKPTSCALLLYVCLKLTYNDLIINTPFRNCGLVIFVLLFIISLYKKIGTISYMILAIVIGYLYKIFI